MSNSTCTVHPARTWYVAISATILAGSKRCSRWTRISSTWGSKAIWAYRCSIGAGEVLGHLAVFDGRPMPPEPRLLFIFRIFATRAAVELERLRIEQQLVESERRYRDLFEEAPNAYVSLGPDRRLISANRRVTELLGYSGRSWWVRQSPSTSLHTPAGRAKADQALAEAFAGAEVSGLELECDARDGNPLWVSLSMRPVRGADGRIQAVHSIWVDITDRVLAESERARLSEQNTYLQQEIKSVHNFRGDRRPEPRSDRGARQGLAALPPRTRRC